MSILPANPLPLLSTLSLLAKSRVPTLAAVLSFIAAPRPASARLDDAAASPAALSLVLSDAEPAFDRRVTGAAEQLGHDYEFHLLHDCRGRAGWSVFDFLVTSPRARLFYRALWIGWRHQRRIAAVLGLGRRFSWTDGLPACWRELGAAVTLRDRLRQRLAEQPPVTGSIVANDLYCAAALINLDEARGLRLVYDSHEFQIDRGRRKGRLRIWVEYGLEAMIIATVDQVLTVNAPLARLMERLFTPATPVRVVHNDHFTSHDLPPVTDPAPLLVFIGTGLAGRMLQEASQGALAGCERALFYTRLPALPPEAAEGWSVRHSGDDYEPALLATVAGRRAFVWCCLADECLSYRLATPNKFFQALALGLPIVSSRGSYLAELCTRHGIGLVLAAEDTARLATELHACDYPAMAAAMCRLRDAFRTGLVEI